MATKVFMSVLHGRLSEIRRSIQVRPGSIRTKSIHGYPCTESYFPLILIISYNINTLCSRVGVASDPSID